MLKTSIRENFNEIIGLLNNLDNESYAFCHQELSDATIGEHVRHIIEMFQSLLNSYEDGIVNYDKRERNLKIQTELDYAITCITFICSQIDKPNKELVLQQGIERIHYNVITNYERELIYNLEHSIHHQALIKVAVLKNSEIQLSENFGVAKSTIEYRNQCVQ